MKARTRKTRWLLIALLCGFLAAAGLALTLRHHAPALASANGASAPTTAVPQHLSTALGTSIGEDQAFTPPAGAHRHWVVSDVYSNTQPSGTNTHSDSHANSGTDWSNQTANTTGDSLGVGGTQPQSNHPATSGTSHPPQSGAGDFAYNGYAPLDCELPAGCGASNTVAAGNVSRLPSGTSGVVPSLHNSQGSNTGDGSGPQQNDGTNPQTNGTPGTSDPPGSQPPVASAPELDPATLAGAITLLLGSLAILRGRRRAHAAR